MFIALTVTEFSQLGTVNPLYDRQQNGHLLMILTHEALKEGCTGLRRLRIAWVGTRQLERHHPRPRQVVSLGRFVLYLALSPEVFLRPHIVESTSI